MLVEEAIWIGNELLKHAKKGDKILNLGSSSSEFRKVIQPHIEEFIFKPLEEKKVQIVHTDITEKTGVDLIGDLTSPEFISKLKTQTYDYIICSNLLEHIENKSLILDSIKSILPEEGRVIITVPFNYPYHLDPIDTMYRPSPVQIHSLFPKFNTISSLVIEGKSYKNNKFYKNYFEQLTDQPRLFFLLATRIFLPFYKPKTWLYNMISLKKMFKNFSVSCVFLKK